MNALDRIQKSMDNFTKTEKEIAIYILNHPLESSRKPIPDVAKSTHSSKSALIRFSQKIGYSGFSEFRFDLSRSLIRTVEQEVEEKNTSTISNIADAYCACIQEIKTMVLQEDLDKIANKIIHARRVKLIGYDRTYLPAYQFRRRLAKIGYDAEGIDDIALMKDMPEILNKDDVIIIFTIQDTAKTYPTIVQEAHASNIPVICFTMTPNLKFKKDCDIYTVLPHISRNSEYAFLDNQAIFLVFIEMLLETIANYQKTE